MIHMEIPVPHPAPGPSARPADGGSGAKLAPPAGKSPPAAGAVRAPRHGGQRRREEPGRPVFALALLLASPPGAGASRLRGPAPAPGRGSVPVTAAALPASIPAKGTRPEGDATAASRKTAPAPTGKTAPAPTGKAAVTPTTGKAAVTPGSTRVPVNGTPGLGPSQLPSNASRPATVRLTPLARRPSPVGAGEPSAAARPDPLRAAPPSAMDPQLPAGAAVWHRRVANVATTAPPAGTVPRSTGSWSATRTVAATAPAAAGSGHAPRAARSPLIRVLAGARPKGEPAAAVTAPQRGGARATALAAPVSRRAAGAPRAPVRYPRFPGTVSTGRRILTGRLAPAAPRPPSAPGPADPPAPRSVVSVVLAPAPTAAGAPGNPAAAVPATPVVPAIVQWVQAVSHRTASIRLHLDPPSLGSVDALVRMDRGEVTLVLTVQRPEAQQSLGHGLGELRTALEAQGFKVGSLAVGVGSHGGEGGGREAPRSRPGGVLRMASDPSAGAPVFGVDRWV